MWIVRLFFIVLPIMFCAGSVTCEETESMTKILKISSPSVFRCVFIEIQVGLVTRFQVYTVCTGFKMESR